MTGPTPELSAHLAAVDTLPPEIIERSRYLLLDGIACGLMGAKLPWSLRAVEGTLAIDGGAGATLWGWNRKVSPWAAALLNGTFVQGFDLDDFHPHGALHSSSVVVTAALAAAETHRSLTFDEFLTAIALGYEVGPRVGIALGGGRVTSRGWHSGAVFGPFAAAGHVYGLDAAGYESAFGNAGTRAGALMAAQYKSMVKRMHHGMAAEAGLHGAALAAAGFQGIERVVEHEYGGLATTMLGGDPDDIGRLSRNWGTDWSMLDIGVKRHACLIMLHSTIDALIEHRATPGFDIGEIDRIVVGVSESVFKRTSWHLEPPGTALGSQMNLRYAVAVALLDGAAYVEQFTPDSLARPAVWDIMDRVDVVHDTDIDALGRDRRFVTNISVNRHDGSRIPLTGVPPQDRPFSGDDVIAKFRGLLGGIMDADRIEAIERLVLDTPADATTDHLVALLADEVGAALPDVDLGDDG